MECPNCRARVLGTEPECPRCGALLDGACVAGADGAVIVESTAERGPVSIELSLPAEGEQAGAGVSGDIAAAVRGDARLVVRRAGLPVELWQQPAVRLVAQAGAGALALTLAMRLLRAWLAHPRSVDRVATTALSSFAEMLQTPMARGAEAARRDRGGEVVETVVYLRRVVRRR